MARSPYRNSERSSEFKRRDQERRSWRDRYDANYRDTLQLRNRADGVDNSSRAQFKRDCSKERKYSREGSAERVMSDVSSGLAHKTPLKRKCEIGSPSAPLRPRKKIVLLKKDDLTDNEQDGEDEKSLKQQLKMKIQEISKLKKNSELKQKTLRKTENLEQRNKKLSEQVESLKIKITEEKEKNETFKNKIEVLEKRQSELENEKARISKTSSNSREEISKKSTEEIRRLRRDIVTLKNDFDENESYLRRVRFDRDNLRVEKKKLESRVEKLEKVDRKGSEEGKIKTENDMLKQVIEEKSKTLERIRSERNNAKHDIEVSKDLIKELNTEKGMLEKTFKDSQNFWTAKKKEIEEKFDDSVQEVTEKVDVKDVTDESGDDGSDDGYSQAFRRPVEKSRDLSDPELEEEGSQVLADDDVESVDGDSADENNHMTQDMFDSHSIIMASDEEWADDFTRVNNIEVFNYKNPKDCAAKSLRAPQKYTNGVFKPTVCCLNNMVNFIAISNSSSPHNTSMKGSCGLKPFCNNTWIEGTRIAKLYIFGTENHPNNETERWCCSHHSSASCKGFQLQTQTLARKKIQHFGTKLGEDNSSVDGVKPLTKRISNRLSLKKKYTTTLTSPRASPTRSEKQGTTPSSRKTGSGTSTAGLGAPGPSSRKTVTSASPSPTHCSKQGSSSSSPTIKSAASSSRPGPRGGKLAAKTKNGPNQDSKM